MLIQDTLQEDMGTIIAQLDAAINVNNDIIRSLSQAAGLLSGTVSSLDFNRSYGLYSVLLQEDFDEVVLDDDILLSLISQVNEFDGIVRKGKKLALHIIEQIESQ